MYEIGLQILQSFQLLSVLEQAQRFMTSPLYTTLKKSQANYPAFYPGDNRLNSQTRDNFWKMQKRRCSSTLSQQPLWYKNTGLGGGFGIVFLTERTSHGGGGHFAAPFHQVSSAILMGLLSRDLSLCRAIFPAWLRGSLSTEIGIWRLENFHTTDRFFKSWKTSKDRKIFFREAWMIIN